MTKEKSILNKIRIGMENIGWNFSTNSFEETMYLNKKEMELIIYDYENIDATHLCEFMYDFIQTLEKIDSEE